jgi:hypothetical protein
MGNPLFGPAAPGVSGDVRPNPGPTNSETPMRILLLGVLAVGLGAVPARAQSGGAYTVGWSTLAAGGATFSAAGAYRVGGSIGQPDAGVLAAGSYVLQGGFWTPAAAPAVDVPRAEVIPSRFVALAPTPNPSRAAVRFVFDLPQARTVRLTVHDLGGRQVRMLLDGERGAGRHTVLWDGNGASGERAPAGMYFVRVDAGDHTATHRFVRLD